MKEAFDPPASVATTPETQKATSSCMIKDMRNGVFAERDAISSHQQWDSMKPEEEDDTDFLSHARRTLSLLDYQEQSSECTYATDVGSHVYSKEAMSPPSEYDRQQPFFPLSSICWENSSSFQTRPGNRDTSGHARTKNSIFGPRDDYLASYPTGPHMRRSYPEAAEVDFSLLDCHSEHRYKGLDRFSAFSNCNGQSIEPRNERVDLPRGAAHCLDDETTSFSSRRWCFENGGRGPSLPRGLLGYGDEIPSLSSRSCNGNGVLSRSDPWSYGAETPSLSSRQGYGDEIPCLSNHKLNGIPRPNQWHEIPSLSSRQSYGDEIPSLSSQKSNGISYSRRWQQQQYDADIPSFSPSRQGYGEEISALSPHWRYRDRIPSYSGQRCHDTEAARRLPSYQQGAASCGNGHPRGYQQGDSFVHGLVSNNQQGRVTTTRHTRPQVANNRPPVSNTNNNNYCRNTNKKENPPRNPEDISHQVCGPRANKTNNASTQQTRTKKKDILSPLVRRDEFNKSDFSVQYEHAKFFMIKSYSEDDIHKGIKYNVWASTPNGNNKLDAAFHDAEALTKEKGTKCPVFLYFSVNTSGQFVGMAEMLGPVDFKKTMDFWQQNKWNGFFPVAWHIIKDIPNRLFRHITLENNDNRPVTFSRDTQEIGLPQGLEVLKIFRAYRHGTSILDDFDFYEEKENTRCARKGINADSLHEARVSYFGTDDLKSLGDLEASMESINLHETWD